MSISTKYRQDSRAGIGRLTQAQRSDAHPFHDVGAHPTPKPVELVADALLDVTKRGQVIFDPFMGSGTTLIAAEAVERVACGIELDPGYVDVTIARWQQMTGKQARHAISGMSFDELRQERLGRPPTEGTGQSPDKSGRKKTIAQQSRSSTATGVHRRSVLDKGANSATEPSV